MTPLLRGVDGRQHFFGVALGLHLGKDFCDGLVGADEERRALYAHHFFAVHVLLFENAKLIADDFVYICEQRVRQLVFFFEFHLRFGRVARDADDYGAGVLQLSELVSKPAGLDSAAGGVGFRIEEKYYRFAGKLRKLHWIAIFILESKISYLVMFLHRIPSLQNCRAALSRKLIRLFNIGAAFAFCAMAVGLPAAAQYPGQISSAKHSVNPRAVAVFEFTGDPSKPTASRLIPVSYFYADAYQDAGIYMAQPAPVALLTGTEYELQHAGMPTGLYDVETAGRIEDTWIGFGDFKTLHPAHAAKSVHSLAASGSNASPEEDDARPHLTKSAAASSPPAEPSKVDADKSATQETATATNPSPLEDHNRPTLKRRASPIGQQQSVPEDPVAESQLNDPDRPHIHRGKAPQDRPGGKNLVGSPADMQQVVAVSDATTREPHPFAYTWNSEEDREHAEQKLTSAVQAAFATGSGSAPALASRRKGVHAARLARPAKAPADPALTDVHIAAFALTYDNAPALVLSAKTNEASPRSVTAIAEVDIYNEPRILFRSVTDAAHRGDRPEMHLVDAVDADGSNRASLLFELRGSSDRVFALYRITRGNAVQTFVTGAVPYGPPIPSPSQ